MKVQIINGDCLEVMRGMEEESVHCCITSPPYWGLRDYGVAGQLGLEKSPEEYVARMVEVFREVRRVLRDDGTLWLNLGDSYVANGSGQVPQTKDHKGSGFAGPNRDGQTGLKPKDLCMIPARCALALQADGWYLRQDIIWSKPNPMPESVTDRCTKAHEYIFLLSKSPRYYYDAEAVKEQASETSLARWNQDIDSQNGSSRVPGKTNGPMRAVGGPRIHGNIAGRDDGGAACNKPGQFTRNRRSVWTVTTKPFRGAHFATFPPDLIRPMVLAGCPVGGTVLDPFGGAGTTGLVAKQEGRNAILIELNPAYCGMGENRIAAVLV